MKSRRLLSWLAACRVVFAAQHPFSVHNDVLAYPQYEIERSQDYISDSDAQILLDAQNTTAHLTEDDDSIWGDASANYYERIIHRGKPHLCAIPRLEAELPTNATGSTQSVAEQEKELIRANNHGWELLEPMRENCIYYAGGWWVYSFCHSEGVKQFHPRGGLPQFPPVQDPEDPGFVLGRFDKPRRLEATSADDLRSNSEEQKDAGKALSVQTQQQGQANYLVQKLGGGTKCDLTGSEREVTVQYHCNPGAHDQIAMIKELASCVYLMVIHTPRLCSDLAFMPPSEEKPNMITCTEIVSEEGLPAWKAVRAAETAHELMSQRDAQSQPLVIGGVEVGAKQLVGDTPERTIKGSNIIKPPQQQRKEQEKFLATLASSDGKYLKVLSDKELKKLGMKKAPAGMDAMIEEVDQFADGKPWRLDFVQGPDGESMIAIVGEKRDETETESTAKKTAAESRETGSEEEYKEKSEL